MTEHSYGTRADSSSEVSPCLSAPLSRARALSLSRTPTPTPARTPTPTPTPRPALQLRQGLINNPNGGAALLKTPTDSRSTFDFIRGVVLENGDSVVVLNEAESGEGTKYFHARCAFGGHEGYIKPCHIDLS